MIARRIKTFIDDFDRAQTLTTTPGMNGWTIKDTSASGTPTYLTGTTADEGSMVLTLDNTSEVQVVTMYTNDCLIYDVRHLKQIWWIANVSGIDAVTTLTFGVGSAQNNTSDSVATNAWFKMDGSVSLTNLVLETDDNTVDNDDKASGATLSSTSKKMLIDFSYGLRDVRFCVDGAQVGIGNGGTDGRFDMTALASGLNVQPWVQLQKASGTGTPAVTITQFGAQYEIAK